MERYWVRDDGPWHGAAIMRHDGCKVAAVLLNAVPVSCKPVHPWKLWERLGRWYWGDAEARQREQQARRSRHKEGLNLADVMAQALCERRDDDAR